MAHVRLLLIAFALVAPLRALAAEVPLESDDQKALYTAGAQVAVNLKGNLDFLELSPEEIATFLAGVTDGFSGKPRLSPEDQEQEKRLEAFRRARMQALLEKESPEAKKFIDKAAKEKGAKKTESGLIYKEISAGKGAAPTATDVVKVHYHGTLRDGTVFDSSRDRGEPVEFPLRGVIPCWTEALQLMKEGGKALLTCPSAIAYGDNGAPQVKIKPGAALAFEVELISISKGQAGAPQMPKGHP